MNEENAKEIVDKIIQQIFNQENPWTLDEAYQKFAFDVRLPQKVIDAATGAESWADAIAAGKFMSQQSINNRDNETGWMREKRDLKSLDEVISAWQEINYMSTERSMDSINVVRSDTIYRSENVYRSSNCFSCKNIIFCDSMDKSEYNLASSRSTTSNFCIRVDDSQACSNSYSVSYSNKVVNSMFVQNAFDLYECLFCAHIACKKFCIANMQFEEEEYYRIKEAVVEWVLKG